MNSNKAKIFLFGATGNVGRKTLSLLLDRVAITPDQISLFASPKSAGSFLEDKGDKFEVKNATDAVLDDSDICIFNTENEISEFFIPKALKAGSYVVDSSSAYRLKKDVDLIVPPVNLDQICLDKKLYSHANCITSPIATVIYPLHLVNPIKRLNITTYQSVSGAGKRAYDECLNQTRAILLDQAYEGKVFKKQIGFNLIPQIGEFLEDGSTTEEYKIIHELQKVVASNIAISATSVRVPVLIGHSAALNIEFKNYVDLQEISNILAASRSVNLQVQDYPTPAQIEGKDDVFVGRIRQDYSKPNSIHLWICSDNLLRGAATDTVEIVQKLLSFF